MGNQQSLHSAAAHNEVPRVEALIRYQHKDVNEKDQDGWTPLHFAAYGGSVEAAQALFRHKAHPEPKDKAERTPLHLAALQGHEVLSSLLISQGANVNARDEMLLTPLHKAAIKGNTEVGEKLLRLGANLHTAAKDGGTALHLAAWKGQELFVRLLLQRGANVQAVTNNKRTALHEAAESGHTDVVKLLLTAGADPHARDEDGEIPGSLAAHAGHTDIANLIAGGGGQSTFQAGVAPSAPPLPTGGTSSGRIHYPEVYQGSAPAPAKEEGRNQDFWGEQLGEKDKEDAHNKSFWAAALGDDVDKPATTQPASDEIASNKRFWDDQLAQGPKEPVPSAQDWDARVNKAEAAWNAQIAHNQNPSAATGQARQQPPNPAQELLRQAQGLFGRLQGKQGGDEARLAEQRRRQKEAQEIDDDWGAGAGAKTTNWAGQPEVPSQQLYNLKPYEDGGSSLHSSADPSLDVLAAQRKLAQLELELDQQQGMLHSSTRAQAEAARARQKRIQEQEAEIAALKGRIAASLPPTRTGGRDVGSGVPKEYLCPITQELMHDPVIAGDGYTYERSAIERWTASGHNSSPVTGGLLPKKDLTPNYSLKSAISEWQSRRNH